MKLSLGAIPFYWSKQNIESFYREIASSSVPLVYLGETVCAKRTELKAADWLALGKELKQAGKQVVISTLALIEERQEIEQMRPLFEQNDFWLEANDMGIIQIAKQHNIPFVAGAPINCYNITALKLLLKSGMKRWVMPVELSRDWLANLLADATEQGIREQFEVEVYGHGYLPLAYSARCFTARSQNLPKDQCQKCCINFPNGRLVENLEGKRMFVLNGIQTMSGNCMNLLGDIAEMKGLVDWFRLSPQAEGTNKLISEIQQQLIAPSTIKLATHECNGYWHKIEGFKIVESED